MCLRLECEEYAEQSVNRAHGDTTRLDLTSKHSIESLTGLMSGKVDTVTRIRAVVPKTMAQTFSLQRKMRLRWRERAHPTTCEIGDGPFCPILTRYEPVTCSQGDRQVEAQKGASRCR
jgi:hypothetical protein